MNKIKTKNLIMKNKGFSIIEAMVAVFILTFAITVLMSVVASSIFQSRYAKNEITATYLAQEVIDYIRNDRDFMFMDGSDDWTIFVDKYTDCQGSDGCRIDATGNTSTVACDGDCDYLNYDANLQSGYLYVYDPDTYPVSPFRRTVNVTMNGNDEMIVTVVVSWKNKGNGGEKSLTMNSSFLNWYQ